MGLILYNLSRSTHYLPSTGLVFLQILTSLIFITILENMYSYYLCFIDEETESLGIWPAVTHVVSVILCHLAPEYLLYAVSQRMHSLNCYQCGDSVGLISFQVSGGNWVPVFSYGPEKQWNELWEIKYAICVYIYI